MATWETPMREEKGGGVHQQVLYIKQKNIIYFFYPAVNFEFMLELSTARNLIKGRFSNGDGSCRLNSMFYAVIQHNPLLGM